VARFRLLRALPARLLRRAERVLAGGLDDAFARTFYGKASTLALDAQARIEFLRGVAEHYDRDEFWKSPDVFFPVPEVAIRETVSSSYARGAGETVDLSWPSAPLPTHPAPDVAERLGSRAPRNEIAHARLYRHLGRPRPLVILVHGYLGGAYAFEERAFPVRWLFSRGVDVALVVLPHHGQRGMRGKRPLILGVDPRASIESFRHAAIDIRTLVRYARSRSDPRVGMMGMSLGGYLTSLVATLEPLDLAVAMIPLASVADAARDGGRLVGTASEREAIHALLDRAHRVVSPLSRPLRVDRERVLIAGAREDRITPLSHAQKLAEHFGVELHVVPGAHLMQLWRGEVFREVGRLLARANFISR
jgi:pimeloyl-ACP methyl ester carboxylesterase